MDRVNPLVLKDWDLIVEHWERPDNKIDASTIAQKRNSTHKLESPISWRDIEDLQDVAGVGHYTTNLTWSWADNPAKGAYLELPAVSQGARAYVNGHAVPKFDLLGGKRDITRFLQEGENEIYLTVPSTLWNYMRTLLEDTVMSGMEPHMPEMTPRMDNGIFGDVLVHFYEKIVLEC